MACDSPLSIRYDPPRPDGKGGFVYWFPADCGKCLNCLIKRKRQWSYRISEHRKEAFSSYFVTLTYDDKFLPMGDDGPCGNKNDHKEFIKWLKYFESKKQLDKRKLVSLEELDRKNKGISQDKELSYFGVLEYGDRFGRPHFHYILFNVVDVGNITLAWSEIVRISKGNYKAKLPKGRIQVDECNDNTIDYVLKYMVKDRSKDVDDKQREVNFMSKGLGLNVVDEEFLKYIKRPEGNQVVNSRGSKVGLPRYYNKKFNTERDRENKRKYIEIALEARREKLEKDIIKSGADPAEVELSGKRHRSNILNKRRKREVD